MNFSLDLAIAFTNEKVYVFLAQLFKSTSKPVFYISKLLIKSIILSVKDTFTATSFLKIQHVLKKSSLYQSYITFLTRVSPTDSLTYRQRNVQVLGPYISLFVDRFGRSPLFCHLEFDKDAIGWTAVVQRTLFFC